jgi:S1-C subfamily serine protease
MALPLCARAESDYVAAIERVKPSVVAVGTFARLRSPQFKFLGTGFVVGDGSLVATNAHVLPRALDTEGQETIAIAMRSAGGKVGVRTARKIAYDASVDLAILKVPGLALPAVSLGDSDQVREGEIMLFTGYPIGAVLGLYPVTHRSMIASITPIAIPAARADQLDARVVRRLAAGSFPVFQLDGIAYPGSSGSPVYHATTGQVVAIINSIVVKSTKESALSQPTGISYAIPVENLRELLERAVR